MSRRFLVWLFLIQIMFIFPSRVWSGFPIYLNEDDGIRLLKGEKRLSLLFAMPKAPQSDYEELRSQIYSDVTLKLRMIGQEIELWDWWHPFLLIELNIIKEEGGDIYHGQIEVSYKKQSTFIKENVFGYTVVWSDSIAFGYSRKDSIRQYVKDMIDSFLNVYLKANPRKFVPE